MTTQHYGYAVREIAFSLRFGCIPIFYADVTDIWMAPPSVRMKVAVAGPYSGWLLGSLAVLLALIIPQAMFILYLFALVCYLGVLVNLYPFVFMELDGYYILTDYLRMPYLMKQTFQVMRDLFTRGHFPARSRENFFSLIHAVFSLISVFMIIAFLVWCIYKGGHT
ncbi:MAG: hypothetical protein Q8Q33_02625 [Chlamydiota bacterium]|nr:hypothetical protein [Chlamydiota bacterium]